MRTKFIWAACSIAAALAANLTEAVAQTYPSRSIRVVVPFAPGGGSDLLGRMIAQKLTDAFKQQAVVENRSGAGGRVGAEYVAHAAPDGYTVLLCGSSAIMIAPAMYPKMPYDPQKDFAPITLVSSSAYVLAVHPVMPAQTVKQLIAIAKSTPRGLTYSSSGPGTPGHLAGELFQAMAHVKIVHVPYGGTSPSIMSVVMGETDLMFSSLLPMASFIQTKRLRAIGVTGPQRSAIIPDVPTIAETLPGYQSVTYYGLLAPAGTPADIVSRINVALVKGLDTPEVRKTLAADGSEPTTSTPDAFARLIKSEVEKWTRVIKDAGIKPE